MVAVLRTALPDPKVPHPDAPVKRAPAGSLRFWLFAAIAFAYATAEATFSNWAAIYLSEEMQLGLAVGGIGLAAFWMALSAGRVLVGVLVLRVPAERVYLVLPLLMAGAALLLGGATTPARAILLFALAGLGCSAFYPLTVSLASRRFPDHTAWAAAMLYAALVAGIGAGSFLAGALRARFPLATIYRLSAFGPAAAFLLAVLALREASVATPAGTGPARPE
jgi:fucose permease